MHTSEQPITLCVNKDEDLREALIDLYLSVKIRSNDEIELCNE